MAAHSKIVDEEEAKVWFYAGLPYSEFVRRYREQYSIETTESMWANWRLRRKLPRRAIHDGTLVPWKVAPEHRFDTPLRYLRYLARARARAELSEAEAERLAVWQQNMDAMDAVVWYHPEHGFRYTKRLPGDVGYVRPPVEDPDDEGQAA